MDDPFGDPFAEAPAPVVKAAAKKPAAAPAAKPAAAAVKKAVVDDPFDTEDPFAQPAKPAASAVASKPTAAAAKSAPAPVAAATKRPAIVDPFAATASSQDEPTAAPAKTASPAPRKVTPPPVAAAVVADTATEEAEKASSRPVSPVAAAAAAEPVAAAADEQAAVQQEPQQQQQQEYSVDEDDAEDELTLVDQELTALPADIVRARGAKLRRIDLSMNRLSSLQSLTWAYGAPSWPALEELILDKNELALLTGLGPGPLPALRTLWLNNNRIDDLEALLTHLEKHAPHLTYLSMLRNPAAPDSYFSDASAGGSGVAAGASGGDSAMDSYKRFRLYVCYRLKKLEFLDATPVSAEERKEATLRGAYCRVAKPQAPKPLKGAAAAAAAASPTNASASATASAAGAGAASPLSPDSAARVGSTVGVSKDNSAPPRVATFLAKGKPRYDGTNSEGNRFIMNDDL